MSPETWFALTTAFVLGAISPGPSLALVLRNTLRGGRGQGILTSVGHGLGFGVYALSVAFALASLLALHEMISIALRWSGALLLLLLGITFLWQSSRQRQFLDEERRPRGRVSFAQGFLMALLNPKILAWMLAIFAPFIKAGASVGSLLAIAMLGMCIDGVWYVLVASILSGTGLIARLQGSSSIIDGAMGALMIALAGLLAMGVV